MSEEADHSTQSVPVPLATPPRKRSLTGLWVALIVVALLGMCGLAGWGVFLAVDSLPPWVSGEAWSSQYVSEDVLWTADGRFAVLQTQDEDGIPMVVVVDMDTKDVREERGVYVATAEAGAPVLWLVRMSDDEWQARLESEDPLPGAGPFDEPPSALEVWDLSDEDAAPSDRAPARWRKVTGSAGWDAYLEIDPLAGAFPRKLLFNNSASSGEGHSAQLPDDFGTFAFLGFSPSGEYVAIEELLLPSEVGHKTRRLLMIRAEDGSAATERELGNAAHTLAWDPTGDRLIWTDYGFDTETRQANWARLVTLSADGVERDAFDVWDCEKPAEWDEVACGAELVGTDSVEQVVCLAVEDENSTRITTVGPGGVTDKGALPWSCSARDYCNQHGFLQSETLWDEDSGSQSQLVRYDSVGGSRTVLWTGPMLGDADTWED